MDLVVRILVFIGARKTDLSQGLQGMFEVNEVLRVRAIVNLDCIRQRLVLRALELAEQICEVLLVVGLFRCIGLHFWN